MLLISEAMLLIIIYYKPFTGYNNLIETVNEVCIIIVCYHMIVVSEMVPKSELKLRINSGYSMVVFISLISLILLGNIVCQILMSIYQNLR